MNVIRLCDVINVDHVKDIPVDYYGVMGVPITYMAIHDPEEFEKKQIRKSGPYGERNVLMGDAEIT